MATSNTHRTHERGNALIFILIAIFLLGGLTVLLSRGSSTTEETGDVERVSIKASEMLKYAAGIKMAVDRLRSQGCSEQQISFWYDINGDGLNTAADFYYNSKSPIDLSCAVLQRQGGGQTNVKPTAKGWTARQHPIGDIIYWTDGPIIASVGTGATDLTMMVVDADPGICAIVNKRAGIPSLDTGTLFLSTPVNGDFSSFPWTVGTGASTFAGHTYGCFEADDGTGSIYNHFYYVLLPR